MKMGVIPAPWEVSSPPLKSPVKEGLKLGLPFFAAWIFCAIICHIFVMDVCIVRLLLAGAAISGAVFFWIGFDSSRIKK